METKDKKERTKDRKCKYWLEEGRCDVSCDISVIACIIRSRAVLIVSEDTSIALWKRGFVHISCKIACCKGVCVSFIRCACTAHSKKREVEMLALCCFNAARESSV